MTSDTLPYAMPQEPGAAKAVILAVLVHAVLFAFLWVGINWVNEAPQSIDPDYVFTQPELDSRPPEPTPVPTPKVEDQTPPVPDPDIATAQEKKRLKEEQEERDRIAAQKKIDEARKEEEDKRKELAKEEAEKKQKEEQRKLADKKQQQDEQKKMQKLHDEEKARIMREAGGAPAGAPTAPGKSSGGGQGNAAWVGKVQAKIKSLIIFNPSPGADPDATAQFSVTLLPDGSVASVRLTKSSGISAWDDAVKRAIENAQPYPNDSSGVVPRQFTSSHRLGDQK
jgi:colicin import membrane protein